MSEENYNNNYNASDNVEGSNHAPSQYPGNVNSLADHLPNPSDEVQGAYYGSEAFNTSQYGRQKSAMRSGEYQDRYASSPVKKKKRKKSSKLANQDGEVVAEKKGGKIIFRLALAIMIAALITLGVIFAGYIEGCMMYQDIAKESFDPGDNDSLDLSKMKVDWARLLAINPDVVAWVYVPGTHINYPVVHTDNNDTYLHKSFRGTTSYISYGSIFMDCNNKHDMSDQNIVTYGHNMNDGSMYGEFAEFRNTDVFNEHRNIYFLTPAGNYRLRTFSCCHVAGTEPIVQVNFSTPAKMIEYINDKITRTTAIPNDTIPNPASMSKIFTFSTCDNLPSNGRYATFAYVAETTVPGVKAASLYSWYA